jgi:hypothetical protein
VAGNDASSSLQWLLQQRSHCLEPDTWFKLVCRELSGKANMRLCWVLPGRESIDKDFLIAALRLQAPRPPNGPNGGRAGLAGYFGVPLETFMRPSTQLSHLGFCASHAQVRRGMRSTKSGIRQQRAEWVAIDWRVYCTSSDHRSGIHGLAATIYTCPCLPMPR